MIDTWMEAVAFALCFGAMVLQFTRDSTLLVDLMVSVAAILVLMVTLAVPA
jgi:hypothetical protein